MSRTWRSAAVIVCGPLLLVGCASGGVLDASREDLIPVQAGVLPDRDIETRIIPAEDRGEPLSLLGQDNEGTMIDTVDLRGQPLVINAWASWCAPCLEEAPILTAAANDPRAQAQFLGLRVMDDMGEAPPALAELPFTSLLDRDGALLVSIPGVPPRAIPSTTVLDAEGRIAAQRIGPLTPEILTEMVTAASQ
ncbi:MAG: TlpA family protein disulfide reductase [Actinobacteria bacterium]|nr:TlpA family protein disulfide reductase [Actinomycetota bacterium]